MTTHETRADQGHEVERGRLLKKLRAGDKAPVVRETFMSCRIRMQKGMWLALSQRTTGADKFPVRYQAVDLVAAKHLKELTEQLNSWVLELPLLATAAMDDGQNEEVDRYLSKHPLGSVQG